MAKRTIYPRQVEQIIDQTLPAEITSAMHKHGWNALGVYELVRLTLNTWKREYKKAHPLATPTTLAKLYEEHRSR